MLCVTPLILELPGPSELEIRRRLTLEGEHDELDPIAIDLNGDFTETKYLLFGLDLEGQQYGVPCYVDFTKLMTR